MKEINEIIEFAIKDIPNSCNTCKGCKNRELIEPVHGGCPAWEWKILQHIKPCAWCKDDTEIFWEHDPDGEGCFMQIESKRKELLTWSPEYCSGFSMQIDIHFCPMCGRRL